MREILEKIDSSVLSVLVMILSGSLMYLCKRVFELAKVSLDKSQKEIAGMVSGLEKTVRSLKVSMTENTHDITKASASIEIESHKIKSQLTTARMDLSKDITGNKIEVAKLGKALDGLKDNVEIFYNTVNSDNGLLRDAVSSSRDNKEKIGKVISSLEDVKTQYGRVRVISGEAMSKASRALILSDSHSKTFTKLKEAVKKRKDG